MSPLCQALLCMESGVPVNISQSGERELRTAPGRYFGGCLEGQPRQLDPGGPDGQATQDTSDHGGGSGHGAGTGGQRICRDPGPAADGQQLRRSPGRQRHSKAQTFTAGLTGQLDQVDLAISGVSVTTPLTVQIRDGSATAPGEAVLATASVPTSAVMSSRVVRPDHLRLSRFGHRGHPVLDRGAQRQRGVTAGSGTRDRVATPDSAYVGGKLYGSYERPTAMGTWTEGNTLADFEFKTYVVPPPTAGPGGSPPRTTPDRQARRGAEEVQEEAEEAGLVEETLQQVQEAGEPAAASELTANPSPRYRFGTDRCVLCVQAFQNPGRIGRSGRSWKQSDS